MPGAKRVAVCINRAGRDIGDEIGPKDIIVRAGAHRRRNCQRDHTGRSDCPEKNAVLENGDDPFLPLPVSCLTGLAKIRAECKRSWFRGNGR